MLILNADEVIQALPMRDVIDAMRSAYAALSSGRAIVPLRTYLPIEDRRAGALFMPAFVPAEDADSLAVKVVTLFPDNPSRNLPFIHAGVLVMDAQTGRILALIEGGALTAIRTGAGAGAATDLLANPGCTIAAVIGSGPQARTQLEAVCAVRPIEEARIYSPKADNVARMIADMQDRVPARLVAARSSDEALAGAQVVCTATNAKSPVFNDESIAPGTHINGVGSYTQEMIEIPPETIGRALVTVDSRTACAAEAGELIRAVEHGLVREEEIVEIGEIALGSHPGRSTPDQVTFFKSVGVAVQDAAAARLALENAARLGLGTKVRW